MENEKSINKTSPLSIFWRLKQKLNDMALAGIQLFINARNVAVV
jgi:hypothetical protein